jgi:multicomponent Na+:H+ antiporter subunit E
VKTLVWNLLLALGWCAIAGDLSLTSFVLGFTIAYVALHIRPGGERYFRKLRGLIEFIGFMAIEIVRATLRVAHDVLTRAHHMRPAVLGVPLDARTDGEITLLAGVIALTPGSLPLDVSLDRRTLYVHVMYVDDAGETIGRLKSGYERRVLELLR